jgi:hypothetical protein
VPIVHSEEKVNVRHARLADSAEPVNPGSSGKIDQKFTCKLPDHLFVI